MNNKWRYTTIAASLLILAFFHETFQLIKPSFLAVAKNLSIEANINICIGAKKSPAKIETQQLVEKPAKSSNRRDRQKKVKKALKRAFKKIFDKLIKR